MQLRRYAQGGIVNESLPDLSKYRQYFPVGFEDWLGRELGWYRMATQDGHETRGDNVKALKEIIKRLEAMIDIQRDSLPPSAEALISEKIYRAWGNQGLADFAFNGLIKHATKLKAACNLALQDIEQQEPQTGRHDSLAQRLFVEVVDSLTDPELIHRCEMAAEVLTLCEASPTSSQDGETLMRLYFRYKAPEPVEKPEVEKTGGALLQEIWR